MYRKYLKMLAAGEATQAIPASKDTTTASKGTKDTKSNITKASDVDFSWDYVEYFYGPERNHKHTWEVDYEREKEKRKRGRKKGRGKRCKNKGRSRSRSKGRKGSKERGKGRSRSRSRSKGRKGSKERGKGRSRSRSGSRGRKGSKDRCKGRSRSRSGSRGRKGSKERGKGRSRSRSGSRGRKGSKDRCKGRSRSRSGSRGRKGSKERGKGRSRSRSGSKGRKGSKDRGKGRSRSRGGSRGRKGSKDRGKGRSRSRSGSKGRKGSKERSRSRSRSSSRSSSREPSPIPKPKPKPKPPKEVEMKGITVLGIDSHVEKNTMKHRTDKYNCVDKANGKTDLPELVLRRGDTFLITIKLDRKYDKKADDMTIVFSFGEKPVPSKNTLAEIEVEESSDAKPVPPNKWGAQLKSQDQSSATIEISIPANCIVGVWDLAVKTHIVGEDKKCITKTYDHPDDVCILFNPWCKNDTVYMENEEELNEYVLNDTGCVYRGNSRTIGAKEWNFGQGSVEFSADSVALVSDCADAPADLELHCPQMAYEKCRRWLRKGKGKQFENPCLDAALYLLRQGCRWMVPLSTMSDPVRASRIIAQMVNCQDDNGVLMGNWSGNYEGGRSPTAWVGSVKILSQFMDTKEPVLYGQCWVFSCVTTTVCRALGIPCRTVTNFSSAHDTNQSNTIDKIYRKNPETNSLELDKFETADSIWNFHVWNEAWMSRPDLGTAEYDGWQVIDSTPQEASAGVMTCGPCPVKAIKAGNCSVDYDTGFVFSEVNADRISWIKDQNSSTVFAKETNVIGKHISTKVPDGLAYRDTGSRFVPNLSEAKRLDLTSHYKFAEDSAEEREAVLMAYKTALNPLPRAYDNMNLKPKPLMLDIVHSYEVKIGSDLDFEVVITNPGKDDRIVEKLAIRVAPESYTGDTGDIFLSKDITDITVPSKGEYRERLVVPCTEYLKHCVQFAMFYIEATGTVDIERDRPLVAFDNFRFRRPDIDVESCGKGKIGEPVEFTLSFKNTLPIPLTKCDVSAESSSGFKAILDVPQPDVPMGEMFKATMSVVPMKKGQQTVLFSFDCEELKDIAGSESVIIE